MEVSEKNFEYQISKLPLDETILLCSKLNLILCNNFLEGIQDNVLRLLCDDNWLDTLHYQRIKDFAKKRKRTLEEEYFFSKISCLELIRWMVELGGNNNICGSNSYARKHGFAQAMLMAFEFWSRRTQQRVKLDEQLILERKELQTFEVLRVTREAHMWQIQTFNPILQFGRASELFLDGFFGQNPDLRAKVECSIGSSLEDYIGCIAELTSLSQTWFEKKLSLVDNFEFDPSRICNNNPKMKKFFDHESQTAKQLSEVYRGKDYSKVTNLRPFRERPIFMAKSGQRATFFDISFLTERASNGLLFQAAKLSEDAMTKFGKSFEKYSIDRLSGYVESLRKNGFSISGQPLVFAKQNNQEIEFADYVLICERTIVIIEIKGAWLNDNAIEKLTAEDYWKEIYLKYVLDNTGPKKKRKGVGQLAYSINGWLKGELIPKIDLTSDDFDTIIPVLFVYDRNLSALFHGTFLAREFGKQLFGESSNSLPELYLMGKKILNLCLVTADDFETFEGRISTRTLGDLLLSYSDQYPERHISAGAYLKFLPCDSMRYESWIVEKSKQAIGKMLIGMGE